MDDWEIKDILGHLHNAVKGICSGANRVFTGRKVRIVSKFRDQPLGTSRKSLTGHIFRITSIDFDSDNVHIWLDGVRCACKPSDIEFLYEKEN